MKYIKITLKYIIYTLPSNWLKDGSKTPTGCCYFLGARYFVQKFYGGVADFVQIFKRVKDVAQHSISSSLYKSAQEA